MNSSPKGSQAAYLNAGMEFSGRLQEDKLLTAYVLYIQKEQRKMNTCTADFPKLLPFTSQRIKRQYRFLRNYFPNCHNILLQTGQESRPSTKGALLLNEHVKSL